jgi:HK97 family phage major capsid protein
MPDGMGAICRAVCSPPNPVPLGNAINPRTAELAGRWLKALLGDDRSRSWLVAKNVMLKAASETLPQSGGGWLVPEDVVNEIVRVVERYGAFRRGADVRTITRDSVVRPRRVGGATMSWLGEDQSIPESNLVVDGLELGLRKLAGLFRCSTELLDDASSDVGAWFIQEAGYAQSLAEDQCGFLGDGTSTYAGTTGLIARMTGTAQAVSAAAGHNTFASIDGTDIAATMAAVIGAALPNSAWYCNPAVLANVLYRLAGTSGGMVSRIMPDGTVQAAYLGYPIYTSGALPNLAGDAKPVLLFGDLSMSAMLVQRHGTLVVATSRMRYLDQDQVLIRCVARLNLAVHDVTPMSVLLGKS